MYLIHLALIVFVIFTIYYVIEFLESDSTEELIRYGSAATLFGFLSGLIRLFGWMQMSQNALKRDILRSQLLVVSLSNKEK